MSDDPNRITLEAANIDSQGDDTYDPEFPDLDDIIITNPSDDVDDTLDLPAA